MKLAQIDLYKQANEQGLAGVPDGLDTQAESGAGFGVMLSGLLSGLMVLAALLVFFYLIWGAIEWITSAGDKSKIEKAREKMTQAMIGLIILAATLALFSLLQAFLNIEVLTFL